MCVSGNLIRNQVVYWERQSMGATHLVALFLSHQSLFEKERATRERDREIVPPLRIIWIEGIRQLHSGWCSHWSLEKRKLEGKKKEREEPVCILFWWILNLPVYCLGAGIWGCQSPAPSALADANAKRGYVINVFLAAIYFRTPSHPVMRTILFNIIFFSFSSFPPISRTSPSQCCLQKEKKKKVLPYKYKVPPPSFFFIRLFFYAPLRVRPITVTCQTEGRDRTAQSRRLVQKNQRDTMIEA